MDKKTKYLIIALSALVALLSIICVLQFNILYMERACGYLLPAVRNPYR